MEEEKRGGKPPRLGSASGASSSLLRPSEERELRRRGPVRDERRPSPSLPAAPRTAGRHQTSAQAAHKAPLRRPDQVRDERRPLPNLRPAAPRTAGRRQTSLQHPLGLPAAAHAPSIAPSPWMSPRLPEREDLYQELPSRPAVEEVEAAAILALADAEEEAMSLQLVALLQEARCSAVRLHALQQRKEAKDVLWFKVFDDLIQRALRVVSPGQGGGSSRVRGDSVVGEVRRKEVAAVAAREITCETNPTMSLRLDVSADHPMDKTAQQSTTMLDKCKSAANASIKDLHESIIIWQILIRLPAKDILRCRAVCKSWRHGTSTRSFMLAHHRRQPSLPVVEVFPIIEHYGVDPDTYPDLSASMDPRLVVLYNHNLRPLVQYAPPGDGYMDLHASCDGLLLVSSTDANLNCRRFYVCNPATRRCNALMQISETDFGKVNIVGFYGHKSGEYRVLYWVPMESNDPEHLESNGGEIAEYHVWTIGSNEPRSIGGPPTALSPCADEVLTDGLMSQDAHNCWNPPVLYRNCLHWNIVGVCLAVFDTEEDTFRVMRWPAQLNEASVWAELMKMNGTLGLCIIDIKCVDGPLVDFWVLQDYEAELWDFKYRINLSEVVVSPPLNQTGKFHGDVLRASLINEREVLIQVCGCMLFCDIDGKFLENVERDEENHFLQITWHWHQESILPLPEMSGPFLYL